ncbi:MAG: nickel-dependent lactate racemase [Methanomicrobia archaeon]|nr:nickel-dependent lactate racemase [Methanomicrobia archaeon]
MMVEIPYGLKNVTLNFRDIETVLPKKSSSDEKKLIEKCIDDLKEFLDENVIYIVNDNQRPTKTKKILENIEIKPEDRIIVAAGAHKHPGDKWLEDTFGTKKNIIVHDAKKSKCTYFGKSSFGNEVFLNNEMEKTKKIVVITSVEPHYFAGFTGGRKSFVPGIAKFETIERNHKHALDKNSKVLKLEGNPVHEEMMEMCRFVKEKKDIFCINMILDSEGKIADIKYGDIEKSFYDACEVSREIYAVKIKKKYDAVISVAKHPIDMTLYQAQKAMENAKLALRDGGKLVLVSQCREGIGASEFYDLLKSGTPEEVMEKIKKDYKLGWHKAAKMVEALRNYEVYAITDLPKNVLEAVNINLWRFSDLKRIEGDILLMPDGGVTVPYL